MIIKKHQASVSKVTNPYTNIYTVEFSLGDSRFKYHPGQFLHLALNEDYDGIGQWPDSRCFSLQSNPQEKNIRITYSVKGDFTSSMSEQLSVGRRVWLKLPYGDLFQRTHNKHRTVFIAGGTGITPYLSLFSDSSFALYDTPSLFAGFRTRQANFYQNELEAAQMINNGFKICINYQDNDGLIDLNEILAFATDETTFFISGPLEMIDFYRTNMISHGVSQDQIRTDDWQ